MFDTIAEKFYSWNEKRLERRYERNQERELKKAHPDVQSFVKKYGKNSAHYSFKSKEQTSQLDFLLDYLRFLETRVSFENTCLESYSKEFKSPVLVLATKKGVDYVLFFLEEDGQIAYAQTYKNGSHGAGVLSLTFELNLPYNCE